MRTLLAALLSPWLLLPTATDDVLVFAPPSGATVAKQFEFELTFSKTTLLFGGLDFHGIGRLELTSSVQFTDTYTKSAGGRPLELLRAFGPLSGKWFVGDTPKDIPGYWALSNSSVRFEWDSESASYTRTRTPKSDLELPLEALVEDADLRGLLPAEPVASGESWTAKGRPVVDALFGAPEMGLLEIPANENEGFVRDLLMLPLRELGARELEIECTNTGAQGEDHPHLTSIGLKLDQRFELDITQACNDFVLASFGWKVVEFDFCRARWEIDGPGTLVWNKAAGRFESFELASKVSLKCDADAMMQGKVFRIELLSEGTARWSGSAQPIE